MEETGNGAIGVQGDVANIADLDRLYKTFLINSVKSHLPVDFPAAPELEEAAI